MLKSIDDIPIPATILGASPKHIYDINIEITSNETATAYKIIAV